MDGCSFASLSLSVALSQIVVSSARPIMWSFAILHWLLPLAMSMDWWCETSNVTGCHGQPRQFVLDTSPDVDKFEVGISSLEFRGFPVTFSVWRTIMGSLAA